MLFVNKAYHSTDEFVKKKQTDDCRNLDGFIPIRGQIRYNRRRKVAEGQIFIIRKGKHMSADFKFRPMNLGGTTLHGRVGEMARRGLGRIHAPEFNGQFLIADLDFNQERWFTNYSGERS